MYKGIIGLILVIVLCFLSFDYGTKRSKLEFEKYKTTQAESILSEQTKLNKVIKEKENEIKNLNSRTNDLLSRMRNRPERESTPQTTVTSTDCPRTGSTGEQLFREDAEFLIGEASKAEVLKQSLLACRATSHRSSDD